MDLLESGTWQANNLQYFASRLSADERNKLAELIREHMPKELQRVTEIAEKEIAQRERRREMELHLHPEE